MSALLSVTNLSKEFGGVHAIEDLSFEVRRGHVHSIIGPNGAGKTTLFNLVTGLYQPSAGTVTLGAATSLAGRPTSCAKWAWRGRFRICRSA